MEMKDRNGLSYKVAGLPQTASGQQRENLLWVLPDQHQQGQGLSQITLNPGIELKNGGTFIKGFAQTFIQALRQRRNRSRWDGSWIPFGQKKTASMGGLWGGLG
jgi:hypothetical protein